MEVVNKTIPFPIDYGRPRSTMVDHGRPWSTMADHGRPWSPMVDHGRPESTVVDQGRPWSTLVDLGRLLQQPKTYIGFFKLDFSSRLFKLDFHFISTVRNISTRRCCSEVRGLLSDEQILFRTPKPKLRLRGFRICQIKNKSHGGDSGCFGPRTSTQSSKICV